MKSFLKGSRGWRVLMVLAPLAILVVLAIATSGFLSASSAAYSGYGVPTHLAPASVYGVSDQMLYVANGQASNVKVIDVGTMSIVDSIPVPNQPTPSILHNLNPGLMNWEVHGVIPSKDRKSVYAVGALSGGSYDGAGNFRLADYEMYQMDAKTKTEIREIPLQSAGQPINPVGFCGLEYNLNDENSNEVIAASMNAANATLKSVLSDPLCQYQNTNPAGTCTGTAGVTYNTYTTDLTLVGKNMPFAIDQVRGSGESVETGGWAMEDLTTGTNTGFMITDQNANLESSTCGIAWTADGTRGFASQMFEPLVDKVNWSTQTVDGSIPSTAGASYHQETADKAAGRLYVANSAHAVDVFDMNTNTLLTKIDIGALTGGTTSNDVHGVELAPGHPDVLYVTSRNTPNASDNMELVVNVADINNPQLIGSVNGLATSVCGVYAIPNKTEYYQANGLAVVGGVLDNQMLFVANGRESDVKVVDVGKMSIVDTIPVPNEVTPGILHDLNPGLMNWEVHGVIASKDRSSIYAVGALSGGSYDAGGNFRLADYEMYQMNTATKTKMREIPLQGASSPINPVGFCGLEYNLNDENSNEVIAASMNAANATLKTVLSDPLCQYQNTNPAGTCTGTAGVTYNTYTTDLTLVGKNMPFAIDQVRGSGESVETGGWAFENLTTGTNTGFMITDQNANLESSTCGVAWTADGTRGFASQMFEPLTDTVNWTTRSVDGSIAATSYAGTSYHQETTDKANGHLFIASSSGRVDVVDMNTNAVIGSIDVDALTGSSSNDVHGVEFNNASGHDILYVTSRNTPDAGGNMELVLHVDDINNPVLLGAINGFAPSVCGVYAINNKADYYGATKPGLSLSKTRVYWGSYADYTAGKLSVDYSIGNTAAANASNVTIVGSNSTNGVTPATSLPLNIGTIAASGSAPVTIQYNVPTGVVGFNTATYATAQNGASLYTYPGPYPGP